MKTPKILIIEDELVHLNVMKTKLEREEYQVISATNGEDGLHLIETEKPDLVLLDIILPKMSGFDVLEHLRENGNTTPVLVVSNSGQPVEVDRAMALGAKDYLVKAEFNPKDVLDKVESLIGKAPQSATSQKIILEQDTSHGRAKKELQKDYVATATGPSVLIIEDDRFLRDLIDQKLQHEGFATITAADGDEGIKVAIEQRPKIILLDLILPGADGFEVLTRLKKEQATANIPIIILSNLGQKEDMERALQGGAEDFMVKAHFTPSEIVSRVRATLQKKYFQ